MISINQDVYKKVNTRDILNKNIALIKNDQIKTIPLKHINNSLYPISLDLSHYGHLIAENIIYNNLTCRLYQYKTGINIYVNDVQSNNTLTRKCFILKNNNFIFSYTDLIDINDVYYKRLIGKYTLTINKNNNEIVNLEHVINFRQIDKGIRHIKIDDRIITFDIECYLDANNNFIPYSCGFYDGNKSYLYYLTDYANKYDMFYACIIDMITFFNKHTIYVHNLSGFDSFFLINSLIKHKNFILDPFYKDNKLYSLTITSFINPKKTNKIIFKDSYLLLKNSLRQLGNDFKVDRLKGYFPYSFVNENNLNYVGKLPEYIYYPENLDYSDYLKMNSDYLENNWSIKTKTLEYLESDLISLYQIIIKFRDEVFKTESINITSVNSISALTNKIYHANYYNPRLNPFYVIKGKTHDDMRQAYYGGRVDVFKSIGKNIFVYDVNSLYPYIMSNRDFPVGKPILSFDKLLDNYFGYVYCNVETPKYLDKPVLPFRSDKGLLYNPVGN